MDRNVFNPRRVRGSLRIPCDRPVVYRLIESAADIEAIAKTKNLSRGGCMFSAPDSLHAETLIEMKISTPIGVATADASVVFSRKEKANGYQVGVRFVRLLPDSRILLENAVPGLRWRTVRADTHPRATSQVQGARAQTMNAVRLTHQGDYGSAIKIFEERIPHLVGGDETDRMVTDFAYSFYGLCLAVDRHRYAEAVDYCNLSLESGFATSIHLYNLAMIYLARDDRKHAFETLDEGLRLDPQNHWINRMIDLLGRRDECFLSFLSRANPLNIALGRLRYRSRKSLRANKRRPRRRKF